MKRLVIVAGLIAALVLVLGTVSTAFASVPKGQLGYEGRPGNQGGWNQAGTTSYEGQPGNQSHH